jgi:hypothetical protein
MSKIDKHILKGDEVVKIRDMNKYIMTGNEIKKPSIIHKHIMADDKPPEIIPFLFTDDKRQRKKRVIKKKIEPEPTPKETIIMSDKPKQIRKKKNDIPVINCPIITVSHINNELSFND